ncbi:MAG: PAS domain-containing protein [Pedobacter sp.]|jgi:PAS domain S-box-containing protein
MEFYIKPFTKQKDTLLGTNLVFSVLSDSDLGDLNSTVLIISQTGLARTKFFRVKDGKRTAYKVHFVPLINEDLKVYQIQITLEHISPQRYKKYLDNLKHFQIHSSFTSTHASAIFDANLNLINFFSNNEISFEKIIQKKSGVIQLKKWLKQVFEGKQISEITLPSNQTGTCSLKISSSGLSQNKDSVCVNFEASDSDHILTSHSEGLQFNKYLLNSIPADIVLWNMDHKYIFLNKNAMPDDELRKWMIGKNDFDLCQYRNKPVEIALKRRKAFNKVISCSEKVFLEEHFKTSDGDIHHLRILQPLRDFDDHIKWVLGYSMDITPIKTIESRLLKMNIAVQETMDGIGVLNEKSEYIYVNDAHVKMFGYDKPEDFIGNTWHMLYNQAEIDRLEKKIFPIIGKRGRWVGETKGKLKNGKDVYQEITLTTLPDGGLICICRDKTEFRENKERIQTAEIIADKITSTVMITDPLRRIIWANKAFEKTTGYKLNEVIGKNPNFLHGPETNEEEVKLFSKKLQHKIPCSAELLNYTKNGVKYWAQINVTPVFDENNNLKSYISVQNDITALKNAELNTKNALTKEKELNELKSQFVSIASHEIRTPLASIQSSSDLIQMFISAEEIPKDKIKKHLDKISSQIFRLSSIMSNLLTIGKINLDKFSLNKNEVDIEKFIQKIITDFFGTNPDGRIVKFSSVGKKRKSDVDKVLMSQVITNLIGNSIKYSKDRSNPEVLLEYNPDNFRISVKDYGIGIPEDQIEHIYDSFFRARNVENIQGTGLGMVIVKKFVEMHKGIIEVESVENKGTTFRLTFPYA